MADSSDGTLAGGNAPAEGSTTSAPRRGPRRIAKPDDLAAAIKSVMATRGLSTREVVRRVPRRHIGTVYRLLAGRTTDPWASTVVSLCTALDADPDELLGVEDATSGLDPELRQMLADVETLSEEDRWLALDMLRAIFARRLHGTAAAVTLSTAATDTTATED